MHYFDLPDFDHHEQVSFVHDAASGLKAIIAIHDTRLGPAMGGCRFWPYPDDEAALIDALRLSHGMTLKSALAGLPIGGGKAVVIGDARRIKTPALLSALGRAIDWLDGRYITAEDVGTSPDDMAHIARVTPFVAGVDADGRSGDPSPWTALGVFHGIRAAVAHRLGTDRLHGVHVAVQGLGHVGAALCRQLVEAGARLTLSDIDPQRTERLAMTLGAATVAPEAIYDVKADVFAPCALGAVINPHTLPRLQVAIVAGAANNVLATDAMAIALADRHILYAPDYAINAGGIIRVCRDYLGQPATVEAEVARIHDTLATLFARAEATRVTPLAAAHLLAQERLAKGR